MSRIVNIVLILTGGLIALYAQAEDNQNVYILIGGIVMLMTGLYRLSRGISSKRIDKDKESVDKQEQ
jgi:disulfide bond formation protein DsbB